jgi:hypothetical protein
MVKGFLLIPLALGQLLAASANGLNCLAAGVSIALWGGWASALIGAGAFTRGGRPGRACGLNLGEHSPVSALLALGSLYLCVPL